jgi:hypothetical protein
VAIAGAIWTIIRKMARLPHVDGTSEVSDVSAGVAMAHNGLYRPLKSRQRPA